MKRKTWYWIIGGVIVVILVLVGVKSKKGSGGENKVFIDEVVKRSITETVSANGKIQPEVNVHISPEISGEIIELNVVEGQQVTQGQLLVKINPDLYQSALSRVEASLNSSRADYANAKARLVQVEAQLKNAKRNFDRNTSLYEKEVISDAEFEAREVEYEQAKAEVEAQKETINAARYMIKSAEASRKEALDNLKRTTIYAPADGTVSGLQVEKGERVVGTGQMAGTTMMDIAQMDRMEVNVEVNESDIVRVALGDTAEIEVDAYLNKTFLGIVTEIANASTNQNAQTMDQVTNFEVKIHILPESYKDIQTGNQSPFKPGMSATVDIRTHTAKSVIAVPIESVTTREDTSSNAKSYDKYRKRKPPKEQNQQEDSKVESVYKTEPKEDKIFTLVFVEEEGKAIIKVVETGIQDDEFIEIKSGLEVEDKVIVGPYDQVSRKLTNGANVEVTEKDRYFDRSEK
jgi:HlyD family secretion protein